MRTGRAHRHVDVAVEIHRKIGGERRGGGTDRGAEMSEASPRGDECRLVRNERQAKASQQKAEASADQPVCQFAPQSLGAPLVSPYAIGGFE